MTTFAYNIREGERTMARPIKETPVITGKDSKVFAEKMANIKPVSKKERDKARKIYEDFKSISKFTL